MQIQQVEYLRGQVSEALAKHQTELERANSLSTQLETGAQQFAEKDRQIQALQNEKATMEEEVQKELTRRAVLSTAELQTATNATKHAEKVAEEAQESVRQARELARQAESAKAAISDELARVKSSLEDLQKDTTSAIHNQEIQEIAQQAEEAVRQAEHEKAAMAEELNRVQMRLENLEKLSSSSIDAEQVQKIAQQAEEAVRQAESEKTAMSEELSRVKSELENVKKTPAPSVQIQEVEVEKIKEVVKLVTVKVESTLAIRHLQKKKKSQRLRQEKSDSIIIAQQKTIASGSEARDELEQQVVALQDQIDFPEVDLAAPTNEAENGGDLISDKKIVVDEVKLAGQETVINELKTKVSVLSTQVSQLTADLSSEKVLRQQVETDNATNIREAEESAEKTALKIQELRKELKSEKWSRNEDLDLRSENSKLKRKLEKAIKDKKMVEEYHTERFDREVGALRSQRRQALDDLLKEEDSTASLKNEIKAFKTQLNDVNEKLSIANEQLKDINELRQKLVTVLESEKSATSLTKEYEREIEGLKADREPLAKESRQLQRQVRRKQAVIDSLEKRKPSDLDYELSDYEEDAPRNRKAKREMSEKERLELEMNLMKESMTFRISGLKDDVELVTSKLESSEIKLAIAEQAVSLNVAKISDMEAELNKLCDEFDTPQEVIYDSDQATAVAEDEHLTANDELDKTNSEVEVEVEKEVEANDEELVPVVPDEILADLGRVDGGGIPLARVSLIVISTFLVFVVALLGCCILLPIQAKSLQHQHLPSLDNNTYFNSLLTFNTQPKMAGESEQVAIESISTQVVAPPIPSVETVTAKPEPQPQPEKEAPPRAIRSFWSLKEASTAEMIAQTLGVFSILSTAAAWMMGLF